MARKNIRRARMLAQQFPYVNEETAGALKSRAESLSHGSFSLADLRRMGHPYRIGSRSFPYGNAGVINDQGGAFARSWKTNILNGPDGSMVVLFNDSPEAKFMLGTEKMVRRPILESVQQLERPGWFKRLRGLVQKALKI